MDPEAPNILHTHSQRADWSRTNEKGVFPGVATPLNWSIWGEIGERSVRRAACDLGLLAEHELELPDSVDDWMWSIFYGRPAANVGSWRALYERGLTKAGAGEAAQHQVFGAAAGGTPARAAIDRRAEVASRRPEVVAAAPERLSRLRSEAAIWWRAATRAPALADPGRCRTHFAEALDWFERADREHIVVSLLATQAVTEISTAAERAGLPEAANALMVGYPGMEEFQTVVALWDLSRGRLGLDEFLGGHGFHGSQEGEIASHSWREVPDPILRLAQRYESLHEDDDPRQREERSVQTRATLEAELRAAVAAAERTALDDALARAAVFLPLREAGRATLTIALDAMRATSRVLGNEFALAGLLASPDDVFLLTRHELLEPPANLERRVNERRGLRDIYQGFELPETWRGMPDKQPIRDGDREPADRQHRILGRGARLEGLGASAGIHEGIARVVLDSSQLAQDFDPGDVLVAPATDPSWAPLFLVAGAVVIDTGSNISHAAVVAREMGIPAVVSARDASRRLRSGQRLRVDGSAGTVEVIA